MGAAHWPYVGTQEPHSITLLGCALGLFSPVPHQNTVMAAGAHGEALRANLPILRLKEAELSFKTPLWLEPTRVSHSSAAAAARREGWGARRPLGARRPRGARKAGWAARRAVGGEEAVGGEAAVMPLPGRGGLLRPAPPYATSRTHPARRQRWRNVAAQHGNGGQEAAAGSWGGGVRGGGVPEGPGVWCREPQPRCLPGSCGRCCPRRALLGAAGSPCGWALAARAEVRPLRGGSSTKVLRTKVSDNFLGLFFTSMNVTVILWKQSNFWVVSAEGSRIPLNKRWLLGVTSQNRFPA